MKNNISELIEHGINTISEEDKIEISVKDFLRLYRVIEENRRFFHNNMHYKKIEDVNLFIGDYKNSGMFAILDAMYLKTLDGYLTQELEEKIESDELYCSDKPYYYLNEEE